MPEYVCGKCGFISIEVGKHLHEPWCASCVDKHRGEYAPVFEKWVMENAEGVLAGMGVPVKYQGCSFENFETKTKEQSSAFRTAQEWVKSSTSGLFLCGRVGTGKTHLAVSALLAVRARHRRWMGRFASVL